MTARNLSPRAATQTARAAGYPAARQPLAKGRIMTARLLHRASAKLLSAAMPGLPLAGALGCLAAFSATPAAAQTVTSPARSIAVGIGRGQLVTLPGRMSDVFVANDQIADVQAKSTNQLYVFGKGPGETTVYASDAKGNVVWSANVRVGTNIDSIDQMLRLAMPEAKIQTATMNNTVLLTGTVAAPEDAAEAERLVKAFVGDKSQVISRLKMATPLQVMLQVRIAEVSRTLTRSIGVNWASADATNGFKFGIGQGASFFNQYAPGGPIGFGTPSTTTMTGLNLPSSGTRLVGNTKLFGVDLLGALDLGETIGLATTLAEPNLTALSGETAQFLAGGEFPIPLSQGLGTTAIEYKKYGVSLSYTPTVLANGRISLRVAPEVSELTSDGAIVLSGMSIPALKVRRAETTIELGSGQSFMIAGLLSNSAQNTITKMPGAGDLPILGSLFRSTAFKKGETELVIVVTPYLVNPVNAKDIKLPTDGFRTADALQQVLGNQESAAPKGDPRPGPTEREGTTQAGPQGPRIGAADPQPAATGRARQARAADTKPGFSL